MHLFFIFWAALHQSMEGPGFGLFSRAIPDYLFFSLEIFSI